MLIWIKSDTSMTRDIKTVIRYVAQFCMLALLTGSSVSALSAERIISIGGSVTEVLHELNIADKIVAVDTTSQYPASIQSLPDIGYMRALSAEPLIALNPDLILYKQGAGPPEVLAMLRQAKMNMVEVNSTPTIPGVFKKIREIATAVNKDKAGEQLIQKITDQQHELNEYIKDIHHQPNVMFILSFEQGAALVAGKDTAANGIIELAGGRNVADNFYSYKPVSAESMLKLSPDYILTTQRAVNALGSLEKIKKLPGLNLTTAIKEDQIIVMDELLLLGFGPRIATASLMLAEQIHTD